MKFIIALLFAGMTVVGFADPAISQTQQTVSAAAPQSRRALPTMSEPTLLSPSQRAAIARDLIQKWQSAAAERPGGDGQRWARVLGKVVAKADAANVLSATNARSVDELHAALTGTSVEAVQPQVSMGTIGNGAVAPQAIGSTTSDLVYTPLPRGRCRIADSRAINSPLVGTRSLAIEDLNNYASQGGNGTYSSGTGSSSCGINDLTTAYALSITLISPTASGQFKVYRYGQPYQTGNSVSMNAGVPFASADLIVRSCQGCAAEIGVQSLSSVHYVIDVIGYYMAPTATALSCYETTDTNTSVNNGALATLGAGTCAANYTRVDTSCYANYGAVTFNQWKGTCYAYNFSGVTAIIYASARCCRVPGR